MSVKELEVRNNRCRLGSFKPSKKMANKTSSKAVSKEPAERYASILSGYGDLKAQGRALTPDVKALLETGLGRVRRRQIWPRGLTQKGWIQCNKMMLD
jgi:hypothetical protein